jgi:hypothetical protein
MKWSYPSICTFPRNLARTFEKTFSPERTVLTQKRWFSHGAKL